jgi:hypothetical protein
MFKLVKRMPKQHFKINHQCLQIGIGTPYESQKFRMHVVIFGLLEIFQCIPYYQNKFNVKKLW